MKNRVRVLAFLGLIISTSSFAQVPGVTPVDIYLNLTNKGFTLTKKLGGANGNLWTCKEETEAYGYVCEIYNSGGTDNVKNIRATVTNNSDADTDELAKDFLAYIGSTPFTGNQPERLSQWVKDNMGRTGKITVAGVTVEMIAKPSVRILIIGK